MEEGKKQPKHPLVTARNGLSPPPRSPRGGHGAAHGAMQRPHSVPQQHDGGRGVGGGSSALPPPAPQTAGRAAVDLSLWRSSIHPLPPPFPPIAPHQTHSAVTSTSPHFTCAIAPHRLLPHIPQPHIPAQDLLLSAPHPPPPHSVCTARRWALQHRGHSCREEHFLSIPKHWGTTWAASSGPDPQVGPMGATSRTQRSWGGRREAAVGAPQALGPLPAAARSDGGFGGTPVQCAPKRAGSPQAECSMMWVGEQLCPSTQLEGGGPAQRFLWPRCVLHWRGEQRSPPGDPPPVPAPNPRPGGCSGLCRSRGGPVRC